MGGSGNKLVPILAALAVAFVAVALMRGNKAEAPAKAGAVRTAPAPDADTAGDTLRSMAAQMAEVKGQAEQAKREAEQARKQQAEDLEGFKRDLQNDRGAAQKAAEARDAENRDLLRRLEDAAKRLAPAAGPAGGPQIPFQGADIPVDGSENGLRWVEPLDRRGGLPAPGAAAPAPAPNPSLLNPAGAEPPKPKPDEPAYTVPRNATLVGSTAMTALVGRVPVKGQIEDPFPFKVLVGKDNLAANGLEIPGVFGMVFSGTAFGDWTLGCVRGHVDSATFVFEDGRTRSFPADTGQGGGGGNASGGGAAGAGNAGSTVHKGLGWISDRRGIPCVSGERISNATDYLAGRMLAMGIETAGKAYARAQQTITTTPLGGNTSVVNNAAQFALGETAAGSSSELAKLIAERQAQMFDVVYVDTGAEVAVHLDKEIPIDYQPNGRKLDYARATHNQTGRGGLD